MCFLLSGWFRPRRGRSRGVPLPAAPKEVEEAHRDCQDRSGGSREWRRRGETLWLTGIFAH